MHTVLIKLTGAHVREAVTQAGAPLSTGGSGGGGGDHHLRLLVDGHVWTTQDTQDTHISGGQSV